MNSAALTAARSGAGDAGRAGSRALAAAPEPGAAFGGYRIERRLGRGGMGDVFEAEQCGSGRRVALKVMAQGLSSEDDRRRFLREGRLAASVSHPNVVYIYGSEEVEGAPVITMELVPGGTLRDLVKRRGPLPVEEAVDRVLEVVAGLRAAHAAGVLHRDVKPANCFLTPDGSVKVGDFGLSIPTAPRSESLITEAGSIMGTPSFAAPEQLRGKALDQRADIYSVGATLFYLLTGRAPFTGDDLVTLIANVLDEAAPSPEIYREEVPKGLAQVVLRCLAKEPGGRFGDYDELERALLPFGGALPEPARPGLRFVAGLLDDLVAAIPDLALSATFASTVVFSESFLARRDLPAALLLGAFFVWRIAYYTVCEGRWGAGVGKAVLGLRVTAPGGKAPGWRRALGRALVFSTFEVLPVAVALVLYSASTYARAVDRGEFLFTDVLPVIVVVSLFLGARRANGYAGLHDRASGTRVVSIPRREGRPAVTPSVPVPAGERGRGELPGRLGPFAVQGCIGDAGDGDLLLGWDDILRRPVWIRRVPEGTPPTPAGRRDLARATRLRWLGGHRGGGEDWDAYEGPAGLPLASALAGAAGWGDLRFWLNDIAEEFLAGQGDPVSAITVRPGNVWVRGDGRAVVLEFPCPGAGQGREPGPVEPPLPEVPPGDLGALQDLLHGVGRKTLAAPSGGEERERWRGPPPVSAGAFLARLGERAFESPEVVLGNLRSLVRRSAAVPTRHRAGGILFPLAVAALLGALTGMAERGDVRSWDAAWAKAYPEHENLRMVLALEVEEGDHANVLQAYAGDVFADVIADPDFWSNRDLGGALIDEEIAYLRAAPAAAEAVPEGQRPLRRSAVAPLVRRRAEIDHLTPLRTATYVATGLVVLGGLASLGLTLVLGAPPVLHLLGHAVVSAAGSPASRLRLAGRWAAGWVPVILAASAAFLFALSVFDWADLAWLRGTKFVFLAIIPAGAFLEHLLRRPWEGWHDRVAGTCVVPR